MDTIDEFLADWREGNIKRLKHRYITFRPYTQDIFPVICEKQPATVIERDIR